jgi:excisionase family DNA binding protein
MRPQMTVPGGMAGRSLRLPGVSASMRGAIAIPASMTDADNSPRERAFSLLAVRQRQQGRQGSDMAVPEPTDQIDPSTNAVARLLARDIREELLTIMREIFERNALAGRLAYSPDEAAELLGISKELIHDLLRTGQLGSRKAGRRRLIAKRHLEAFLAGEP